MRRLLQAGSRLSRGTGLPTSCVAARGQTVELTDDVGRMDPDRTEALAVLGVIQTLPEAYRETLVLRLVEGMTGPEIAARTGLTAASVRVNLHRGMKQLRERLGVLV
mgnify:CR=1 FL=1